jgi:hypothetical protein
MLQQRISSTDLVWSWSYVDVNVLTSSDARVDLGSASTELEIFGSVVVHAGKL